MKQKLNTQNNMDKPLNYLTLVHGIIEFMLYIPCFSGAKTVICLLKSSHVVITVSEGQAETDSGNMRDFKMVLRCGDATSQQFDL